MSDSPPEDITDLSRFRANKATAPGADVERGARRTRTAGRSSVSTSGKHGTVSDYSPGRSFVCKILTKDIDGYTVILTKDNVPGYLKTEQELQIGQETMGSFVTYYNGRYILESVFRADQLNGASDEQTLDENNVVPLKKGD